MNKLVASVAEKPFKEHWAFVFLTESCRSNAATILLNCPLLVKLLDTRSQVSQEFETYGLDTLFQLLNY